MEALRSPKITVGVHCTKIRTKSMYLQATVDPDEATFYDHCDTAAYWCVETQSGLGPDREPVRPDVCCGDRCCCTL
jgi:hypothetical protein